MQLVVGDLLNLTLRVSHIDKSGALYLSPIASKSSDIFSATMCFRIEPNGAVAMCHHPITDPEPTGMHTVEDLRGNHS